jgi:hypothetical protein
MKIYCKNGYIVGREPKTDAQELVRNENGVATPKGVTTAGGIILMKDDVAVGDTGHEIEVVASEVPDLKPGDRVIAYLGNGVAGGISAFFPIDGVEHFALPEKEIWAKMKDGEVIPRHNQILVERDDAAMKRYAFGGSDILRPENIMEHGVSATGEADPLEGGDRKRDAVTLAYQRVVRRGPDVKDSQLCVGSVVAFSPSYCCTRLIRNVVDANGRNSKRYYHLVPADELFFAVDG